MTPVVETRDLFCVYPSRQGGVAALQGLTLSVEEGEICVVLGPSGSGKTTLMRTLAGLERPSSGSITVAGLDLGSLPARRLGRYRSETLGYADQHYWRALAGELTAEELVAVPLGLAGVEPAARRARAHGLLERVGLRDRAGALPGELSGGEQQRIALCAALARRPRLLIADEPTGELDRVSADGIYQLLAGLTREQGVTALIVSHDPQSAGIADRVVHIRDGRVSEEESEDGQAVVVGRGGWLRIPAETLRAAGIHDRASVTLGDRAVELRPLGEAAPREATAVTGVRGGKGRPRRGPGLIRRYGAQLALGSFTATFEPGRLTVVTGPSGSGKSTPLSLLAGLDVPDEGEVVIGGITVSALDRDGGRLSGVTTSLSSASPPSLRLSQREGERRARPRRARRRRGGGTRAVGRRARRGRPRRARRPQGRAPSAGQRERVAIARALAARPSVILADEPTARIDMGGALALGRPLRRHRERVRDHLRLRYPRSAADRPRRRAGGARRARPGTMTGRR